MPPREPTDRAGQIMTAGRLFLTALVGEEGEFEREVLTRLDADDRAKRGDGAREVIAAPHAPAATTPASSAALPPSVLRCADCNREQSIPATFGRADVERLGWRRVDRAWRCSLCAE